jgi:hypothetical protein
MSAVKCSDTIFLDKVFYLLMQVYVYYLFNVSKYFSSHDIFSCLPLQYGVQANELYISNRGSVVSFNAKNGGK